MGNFVSKSFGPCLSTCSGYTVHVCVYVTYICEFNPTTLLKWTVENNHFSKHSWWMVITNSAAGPDQSAADHQWQQSAACASSPAAQGWAEMSSGHQSPWSQHPSLTGSPNKGMKTVVTVHAISCSAIKHLCCFCICRYFARVPRPLLVRTCHDDINAYLPFKVKPV